jgi:hypothetical protein
VLPLVGAWIGEGSLVDLSADETVLVGTQIVFGHDGRDFLSYDQRTWQMPVGSPPGPAPEAIAATRETGFWRRGFGQDAVEIMLADPTGAILTMTGIAGDARYEVATDATQRTPTGRAAWPERRMYAVIGDRLLLIAERRVDDVWYPYLNTSLARRRARS